MQAIEIYVNSKKMNKYKSNDINKTLLEMISINDINKDG